MFFSSAPFAGAFFYLTEVIMAVLKINGKQRQFADDKMPATLDDLLSLLNIEKAAIVAEVDGEIVSRDRFSGTRLSDGQNIELIKFMGGG